MLIKYQIATGYQQIYE